MTSKDAATPIDSLDDTSAQLDHAIDELRGVLKEEKTGRAQARGDEQAGRTATMKTAPATAFADFGEEATRDDTAAAQGSDHARRLDVVMDIPIDVQIVLGSSRMPVSALMNLSEGATIALDRKIGEPVEITVNGRVVGHGEITVLEDDDTRFGIRLIDMLAPSKG